MEQRARDVLKIGDALFSKRTQLDSLWQEIALNFYPERADFTSKRNEGEEFNDHNFSSYPILARRELGNVLSSYLYSRSQKRFSIHVTDEDLDRSDAERKFLETVTDIQWRAMYDAPAMLSRTAKESAHDFASFGNAVIKFGLNFAGDGLLFRSYHLRDNAWTENGEGKIDCNHRNWCPTARQLKHHFPDKISKNVREACIKDPEKTFDCRHVVMPSRLYDCQNQNGKRFPFVSLCIERESQNVLEEVGISHFPYVIPRWQTISGSQYAVSMATGIVLPDGRTMQIVVRTIREAGEKYADPPMVAIAEAIRGDIALMAGGVTMADMEYDERLGEVLRPVTQQHGGFPISIEVAAALREDIRSGFFLDKIQLPETGPDMTAFEVRRRVEEHIRAQTPIFDPIEEEYAPLYEGTFQLMADAGAFPMHEMPESLTDQDIRFSFFSPLSDLADQREAETFVDVRDRILGPMAALKPELWELADWETSTRDAMRAGGWKAKWNGAPGAVQARAEQIAKQAMLAKGMEAMGAMGAVAEQGGKGMAALRDAGNGGQAG